MPSVVFGESTISKTRVYEWYKRFSEVREKVEEGSLSGRPSTSTTDDNVKQVKKFDESLSAKVLMIPPYHLTHF